MRDYVLIKKYIVGIVHCVSILVFRKFELCPECVYSAVCWSEMITFISGLCYLSIFLNFEWL